MALAQCISGFTVSYGLPVSLFLAGLVGGVTHCAGMCSPFVLAQVNGCKELKKLSSYLLLPYHLGRMTTYVVLAVVFSGLINLAFLFSEAKILLTAPLLIVAGIMFFVTAFPALAEVFPWVIKLQNARPFAGVSRLSGKMMDNPGVLRRYILGVLLGFMPCGLVVSAVMAASSAATPLHAALAMAAFTLGTMPALILVAFGGGALQYKYPRLCAHLSKGALIISSLWLFALAGTMLSGQ